MSARVLESLGRRERKRTTLCLLGSTQSREKFRIQFNVKKLIFRTESYIKSNTTSHCVIVVRVSRTTTLFMVKTASRRLYDQRQSIVS